MTTHTHNRTRIHAHAVDHDLQKEAADMTYDHSISAIHRADLDREIDAILNERALAESAGPRDGIVERARRGTGRILISAGTALMGREPAALRTHRA
jgi:hypothetical protein